MIILNYLIQNFETITTIICTILLISLLISHRSRLLNLLPSFHNLAKPNKKLIFMLLATMLGFTHLKGLFMFLNNHGHGIIIVYLLFLIPVLFIKLLEIESSFCILKSNTYVFPLMQAVCSITRTIFYTSFILSGLDILSAKAVIDSLSLVTIAHSIPYAHIIFYSCVIIIALVVILSSWKGSSIISCSITLAVLTSAFICIIVRSKNILCFIMNYQIADFTFISMLNTIYYGMVLAMYSTDLCTGYAAFCLKIDRDSMKDPSQFEDKKYSIISSVCYGLIINCFMILLLYLAFIGISAHEQTLCHGLFDLYKIYIPNIHPVFSLFASAFMLLPCVISMRIAVESILYTEYHLPAYIVKVVFLILWILLGKFHYISIDKLQGPIFFLFMVQVIINMFAISKILTKSDNEQSIGS